MPLDPEYERQVKVSYTDFRQAARQSRIGFVVPVTETPALSVSAEEREREYEARWQRGGLGFGFSFPDLLIDEQANETAAEFFRNKISSIVQDPEVAETLAPRGYPLGTKRMCVDTDYYATFNRDNVALVDLREATIETIPSRGLRTTEDEYEVDAIVFAISYTMTGLVADQHSRPRRHRLARQMARQAARISGSPSSASRTCS